MAPATSPFLWSAWQRLAAAAGLAAGLWVAVAAALGWWG
jgi:hypothetical protein